jgi:ketosteroid isomerase-like protein
MKFKSFSILLVVVLSFGLIFFGSCEKKAAKLNLKKAFADKISERNSRLVQLFHEGSTAHKEDKEEAKERVADEIANLFTEDTILIVPNAKKTKGKKDISKFWKKAMDDSVTSVAFEVEDIYVSGQVEMFPDGVVLPEGGELAYVIGTCTFETIEEEKLLKNTKLNWIEILRHQKICDRESCVFSLSAAEPSSNE